MVNEANGGIEALQQELRDKESLIASLSKEVQDKAAVHQQQLAAKDVTITELQESIKGKVAQVADAKLALRKFDQDLQEVKGQLVVVGQKASILDELGQVLRVVIGLPGATPFPTGAFNEDALVARVLARIPAQGQVLQVTPVEALREEYREAAVQRVLHAVQQLSPLARQAVRWLQAVGRPATTMDVGRGLGLADLGKDKVELGKAIQELLEARLVSKDNKWLRPSLDDRLLADLGPYGAADQQGWSAEAMSRLLFLVQQEGRPPSDVLKEKA